MIGTLVNAAAVVAGSSVGLVLRKSLPGSYRDVYFLAVGLFTLSLGVKMAMDMASPLLVVASLILGGFAGVRMQLERNAERLGDYIKAKTRSANDRFTE